MKAAHFHYVNLAKHKVGIGEAFEALKDGWRKRKKEGSYLEILGRTGDGRHLQLLVEDQEEQLWVFHGREMTPAERRRYRRK